MPSAMYFFFRISCLLLQALNETVMAITAIVVRSTDMRLKARPGYIIRWLILLLISSFLCDAVQQFPCSLDRKSVVSGKSVSVRVDLGGRRLIKKKKT